MAIYIVAYDIKNEDRVHEIHLYLKKFQHRKKLESFWIIDTTKPALEIRNDLEVLIGREDTIFVGELKRHWAGYRMRIKKWMQQRLRTWDKVKWKNKKQNYLRRC